MMSTASLLVRMDSCLPVEVVTGRSVYGMSAQGSCIADLTSIRVRRPIRHRMRSIVYRLVRMDRHLPVGQSLKSTSGMLARVSSAGH